MKIGLGRWSEQLRRLMHIAGEEAMDLDEVIQAVMVLEHDRPEWAFLKGEKLAFSLVSLTAVALERSAARITNPGNSGVLVVVEAILIAVGGASNGALRQGTTFPTPSTAVERVRDSRLGAQGTAAVVEGENDTTANIGGVTVAQANVRVVQVLSTDAVERWSEWTHPIILAPGSDVAVVTGADNQSLAITFVWRERSLDRYER